MMKAQRTSGRYNTKFKKGIVPGTGTEKGEMKMTNDKISELLNKQINEELYSAYLYLDCAKHFDCAGLKGFANWYKVQAHEELEHAMKFYNYMQDQGCHIELKKLQAPNLTEASGKGDGTERHLEVAKQGLDHEKHITKMINAIYDEAVQASDYRTMNFLDWFVAEQAEEETNARDMVDLLKLINDCSAALYIADSKMGERK